MNKKNWLGKTFRNISWDFEIAGFVPRIGQNLNSDDFIAKVKDAHINSVTLVAKDHYGYSYYDTKVGYKHPHLTKDILRELSEASYKNRIKIMIYYSAGVDIQSVTVNPDWGHYNAEELNTTGSSYKMVCFNSPYIEKLVLPQLEELVQGYKADGFIFDILYPTVGKGCYCQYCKSKFKKEFHCENFPKKEDPLWAKYASWRRETVDNFLKVTADKIHTLRQELLVGYNWAYNTQQPVIPPNYIDYLTMDVIEIEPTSLNISFDGRYLSTLELPFYIQNTRFLHWWNDWDFKPTISLKQECATVLANGGSCSIGDRIYPDGTFEPKLYNDIIKNVCKFIKEREGFCKYAKPIPYIAILHSASTLYYKGGGLIDSQESRKALIPIRGAHKALVESNYHFNIINEETLLETIDSYKTVILPEQSCLSLRVIDKLKEFVYKGGRLISSYSIIVKDDTSGREIDLSEFFGVTYVSKYPHSYGYIKVIDKSISLRVKDLLLLVEGRFLAVKPTTARVLCMLNNPLDENPVKRMRYLVGVAPPGKSSGFPAITINRFGKGKVVYISGEIFQAYWEKNQLHLKYLLKNIIDLITREKIIEVEAPPCIEVSLFQQGNKTIVHLVNYHTEKVVTGPSFAEYIPPISDIKVRLKRERKPNKVIHIPGGKKIKWKMEDSILSFCVPQVEIHSLIVIE